MNYISAEDPKYTIAVCNYNMENTLEESLRSMLDQVDDRFEVLVIDDGSTDNSQQILGRLSNEYDKLRWKEISTKYLNSTRKEANKEARGDYILPQLDADDRYEEVILDFIEIYHQLEEKLNSEFYLQGNHLQIGPKSLILEYNYRNLGYGGDKDFWRRLEADNKLIRIRHKSVKESIGYDREGVETITNSIEEMETEFRSGITFSSYLKWKLNNISVKDDYLIAALSPLIFIKSIIKGRYNAPKEFKTKGSLEDAITPFPTLNDLENEYDVELDRSKISNKGLNKFFMEDND